MLIGSGLKGVGGTALLYHSPDLVEWEYLHPLCVGDKSETGEMWECPDFFPLGSRHVLLVSVLQTTLALLGTYENGRFTAESVQNLDHGGYFYAAKSFLDGQGRRIVWAWIWEGRSAVGWAGVMSLPRVITRGADGRLQMEVAPELQALRGERRALSDQRLAPGRPFELDGVRGDCLEIAAEIDVGSAAQVGLRVRRSPDGEEETVVVYDRDLRTITQDRTRSSLGEGLEQSLRSGPLHSAPDEPLRLRVFLDRSVIETFANDRTCLTGRVYPKRPDSLAVQLFAAGGAATVRRLECWQMQPIWAD
jgi:beta-fructofuranosidase